MREDQGESRLEKEGREARRPARRRGKGGLGLTVDQRRCLTDRRLALHLSFTATNIGTIFSHMSAQGNSSCDSSHLTHPPAETAAGINAPDPTASADLEHPPTPLPQRNVGPLGSESSGGQGDLAASNTQHASTSGVDRSSTASGASYTGMLHLGPVLKAECSRWVSLELS